MSEQGKPETLLEAIQYFSDLDVATSFVAALRWPNGPVCPECGGVEYSYLKTRRLWKCKECKKQYSVKLNTIFEDSPLGLNKWLPAVWLIANAKNGISSHELARALGVTQKSSWYMLHRIRLAMQTGSFEKLDGEVEVDETYVGGRAKNMHQHIRKQKITGRGGHNKTIVMGFKERGGRVQSTIVSGTHGTILKGEVTQRVAPGSAIYTDVHGGYKGLNEMGYAHGKVDHRHAYVEGRVHTNGLENFWSLLKRGLYGTYVSVDPKHLYRYVEERLFTYNLRELDDYGRFTAVLRAAAGRRLTYAELTAQPSRP